MKPWAYEELDPKLTELVGVLDDALQKHFGGADFPNPEGWTFEGVMPRRFGKLVAAARFARGKRVVYVTLSPTDPNNQNTYTRTPHYDVAYVFENVPETERPSQWTENRGLLDLFATWLTSWDTAEAS